MQGTSRIQLNQRGTDGRSQLHSRSVSKLRKANIDSRLSPYLHGEVNAALWEAIAGNGTVVGRGDTATEALNQARAKGYGAQDVVLNKVQSGGLIST